MTLEDKVAAVTLRELVARALARASGWDDVDLILEDDSARAFMLTLADAAIAAMAEAVEVDVRMRKYADEYSEVTYDEHRRRVDALLARLAAQAATIAELRAEVARLRGGYTLDDSIVSAFDGEAVVKRVAKKLRGEEP